MQRTFAVLILVSVAAALSAEDVGKVEFQQGKGYQFPEEMLSYNVQTAKGMAFDQKILDEDVKRLFSTGNFADVVAEVGKAPDGKIDVIFKLKPKPRIRKLTLEGNKKFPEEKLRDCIVLMSGGPLNDNDLRETLKKLREYYVDKGYNSASFSPETANVADGEVDVTIRINENLRKKVSSVEFTGNTVHSSFSLRQEIFTHHSYFSWMFNTGLLDEQMFDMDKECLKNLYWNDGYLDFKVEDIELKDDPEDPEYVAVTFHLFEGEPYKVQEVSVTGNTKFTAEEISQAVKPRRTLVDKLCFWEAPEDESTPGFKLRTDETYDNRKEEADIKNIEAIYSPLGYCDYTCKVVRVPDFKTHTVNVEYRISEGVPYTVRDLNIIGNTNTKDKVIRREMAIQPGDPVDKELMEASKARLMGMDYFKTVEIVSVNTEEAGKRDVNVNLEEKDTLKLSLGAGMSDTDSLTGTIGITQTNFDLFDPWNYFVGGGQRASLTAMYGIDEYEFMANFSEPWLFDIPLRLDVSGFFNNRDYRYWSEQRGGGSISVTKPFWEFNSVSFGYTIQNVRVWDMDKDLSEMFQEQKGNYFENLLTLTLARDTRDSVMEPTSGYLLKALGQLNVSDKPFYKLEAEASNYLPFYKKLFVLHTGVKYGQIGRLGSGDMVPIFERYFLGGGDTVRGFPYREISPKDQNHDPYGGQSMILATAEVTHPIYKFIRGAVFVDAGGVWEDTWHMSMNGINVGTGYGLRIKVPYINAPVKLDLAYPVVIGKDEHISKKFRFHFNIGFTWSP